MLLQLCSRNGNKLGSPEKQRCQNQSACVRDLLEKTSVRNRGKGPGKSREILHSMTKIWHLWKENREEDWGGRSSDHNAVWRKHKSVHQRRQPQVSWNPVCPQAGTATLLYSVLSEQQTVTVWLGSDECRGEATGRVNQLCSQPSLSRGGTATEGQPHSHKECPWDTACTCKECKWPQWFTAREVTNNYISTLQNMK